MVENKTQAWRSHPLCVDLDGTLIRTDSMIEACGWLWRRKPLAFLRLLFFEAFWSRARFKWELYSQTNLREIPVPFNEPLIAWLRKQKARGRKLLLISATPQFWVEQMGLRTGEVAGADLFDECVGSTPTQNRRGKKKARYLVGRFGAKGFDYVGNGQADLAVWKAARGAYNVNPSARLKTAAHAAGVELHTLAENPQSELMERWDDFLRMRLGLTASAFAGALAGLALWLACTSRSLNLW